MIEEELRSTSGFNDIDKSRNGVGGSLGDEEGAEASERGIEMGEALLEPPSGDPAGIVVALLLRRPDEDGNDGAGPDAGGQSWVILYPEIPSEPDYAATAT